MIKFKISFPTELSSIQDIENDNIDVFIELEDKTSCTLVVTTPKNLIKQMENEQLKYIPASPPQIIVKSLTEDHIIEAIKDFARDDAYWLKYYYLAGNIDIAALDNQLEEIRE